MLERELVWSSTLTLVIWASTVLMPSPAGAEEVSGQRIFENKSGKKIKVTLFIGQGENPVDDSHTRTIDLGATWPDSRADAVFVGEPGSGGYALLNAILIEWSDTEGLVGVSKRVVARGDAVDKLLNHQDTIVISSVSPGQLETKASDVPH